MSGETNLKKLLQDMDPKRNPGEYVFCRVNIYERAAGLQPLGMFRETEGITVILPRQQADEESLEYDLVCAWITLTVHSSLEAVGLTAAVSKALAEAGISCNVVAAYYHDHIFVSVTEADRAIEALSSLT